MDILSSCKVFHQMSPSSIHPHQLIGIKNYQVNKPLQLVLMMINLQHLSSSFPPPYFMSTEKSDDLSGDEMMHPNKSKK